MNLGGIVLHKNNGRRVVPHQTFKVTVIDTGRPLVQKDIPLRWREQVAGFPKRFEIIASGSGVLRASYPVHKAVHGNASHSRRARWIPRVAGTFINGYGF